MSARIGANGCVVGPVGAAMRSVAHRPGYAGNIIIPLITGKLADARRRNAANVIAMIGISIGRIVLRSSHVGIIRVVLRSRMVMPRHGRRSDDGRSDEGSRKKFELSHLFSPFLFEADALGFMTELGRASEDLQHN